ncbi:MFS transporter [Staphylococcus massiliensis]|uniref:Putative transporter protein n=1 Tax=Staphylococcus massiliensis S46 TaxID=1229783 RepID=K9ASD3_9STAP|nr:MFS transporter [Staphylococcus massiliensis]EKU48941.1 putative transporter protein [Staphylococcus massiliensis S46]MCG3399381.1 MFS transporter [Staphylococcus massiliensis]MCG3402518.1 MFS transporter [Staphylococcus massiliensis]MCG3411518.1 MFS transporter [Staphylococcus massiliensis]PNZ98777.1 MFS transporter [Staphylococcus massiliensis CCUG 55927]
MTITSKRETIWSKNFIINFAINFLVYLCMYLLIVIVASYASNHFNASDSLAGLVSGLFIVGSLIGRFITGRFVNSLGPKKILLIGLILLTITQFFYFIDHSIWILMLTRIVNGIATGVATTATGSLAAFIAPDSRKSESISLFSLSLVLGAAIGPFFGLLLSQIYPIQFLFILCIMLCMISFVLACFIHHHFETTPLTQADKQIRLNQFIAKEAIPVAFLMMLIGVGYAAILSFLQFFAEERDLVTASQYFFMFYALTSLFARPIVGRLMDQKSDNVVAYPSFIFFIISLFVLSMSHSSFMLLLAGALVGIGYGNLSSIFQAAAVKSVSPMKMGLATSTYFIGLDIGIGFGPYVLGFFTNQTGYGMMYFYLGILAIITMVLYYFLHGRKTAKQS